MRDETVAVELGPNGQVARAKDGNENLQPRISNGKLSSRDVEDRLYALAAKLDTSQQAFK